MKHLKKLALATTIALAGLTSAHAQQIAGSGTPVAQLNTFGGDNQWTFSDAGLQLMDPSTFLFDAGPLVHTAGSTFVDVFFLNVPDNEYVSFDFGNVRGTRPSVSFTEFDLGFADGTGPVVDEVPFGPKTYSVSSDTYKLSTGLYEFDISGEFLANGGSFEGDIFGSPVPEPENLAMVLAGLGALGWLARRRRNTQA
jgi:PEP-CTERM motif